MNVRGRFRMGGFVFMTSGSPSIICGFPSRVAALFTAADIGVHMSLCLFERIAHITRCDKMDEAFYVSMKTGCGVVVIWLVFLLLLVIVSAWNTLKGLRLGIGLWGVRRSCVSAEVVTIDGWVEVVATVVEVLAEWSEVATIDGSPEVVATDVEVLAKWSEIVIAGNCVLVIPGWSVVAEIRASGCAVGYVTAELS
ncbi:hypothetical protein DY000_02018549 [Brassica cretica]|uniref:Transmembrane protein n=1 Tax=Brassica cretica TaxID=69181 RepID=A0ABQ7CN10_BRACR|nr:hypothetical protein DY000_02018549 [Brassica cretica]